jgi:4-diphosphocytidyl-2-C-methyl-D-erythritol kinase
VVALKELRLNAYAKINLSLDVLARRDDGYHDIETVMHTIELHDTLILRETGAGISVRCDQKSVPTDVQNVVFRTAQLLQETYALQRDIEIEIQKRIPTAAGLGGGSSDAAVALLGLAQLWKLRIDQQKLMELAAKLGSDVPFFLVGGAAIATGRGDKVDFLRTLPTTWIVLACPAIEVATAWAYGKLNLGEIGARPDTSGLVAALRSGDVSGVARRLVNVFEPLIASHHPEVAAAKARLLANKALGAGLTGTGPVVFALFDGERTARAAADALAADFNGQVVVTRTFRELER